MNKPIKNMVVVGGGTAGWLSALYMQKIFGSEVNITVVNSEKIPPVGVGEATIPTWGRTMAFLGFEEAEWMAATNATYKLAIKFVDWAKTPVENKSSHYWHPFFPRPMPVLKPFDKPFMYPVGEGVSAVDCAMEAITKNQELSLAKLLSPATNLCEEGMVVSDEDAMDLKIAKAHHFDAGLMAQFLMKRAQKLGVKHVLGHIKTVNTDEEGFITSVVPEGSDPIEGDFFIDCSGFNSLLINQTLNVPFKRDSSSLMCDSAVAIQTKPLGSDSDIVPYTTSTALNSGWVWDVPLRNRNGCGYVYSSKHRTTDEAEKELRDFLGDRAEGMMAKHLKLRVGRNERVWEKNCLAIGLAASFIEPLESTALFLTEWGLGLFAKLQPGTLNCSGRAEQYNHYMAEMYDEIRDFILMHYYLSERRDTGFWQEATSEEVLTDSLKKKLVHYKEALPIEDDLKIRFFRTPSIACILDGYSSLPEETHPMLDLVSDKDKEEFLDTLSGAKKLAGKKLYKQRDLLN